MFVWKLASLVVVFANNISPAPNPGDNHILQSGILFNFQQKVLVAEKFVNIKFVLPFPPYNATLSKYLNVLAQSLSNNWYVPTELCQLKYTETNVTTTSAEWIYNITQTEHNRARSDLRNLISEIRNLLSPKQSSKREKRAMGMALGVGAGIMGLGLGLASGDSCFLGILGGCNELGSENRNAVLSTVHYVNEMNARWKEAAGTIDNKFFVLGEEINDMKKQQQDITTAQNANFETIHGQMLAIEKNMHALRNCDQFFFSRQQMNQHLASISSILNTLQTLIRSYRLALANFRANLLQNLSVMVNGFLPLSIISKEILHEIRIAVMTNEIENGSRLTLAIPLNEILTYYESKLLLKVESDEAGVIFTFSVPFASKSTILTVYEAIPIPMPLQDGTANLWDLEEQYIATTDDQSETAAVSKNDLEKCVGSKVYTICEQTFAMEKTSSTCLAALLLQDQYRSMENCNLKPVKLPLKEKARNLGFGRWLVTCAHSKYKLQERRMNSSLPMPIKIHEGCNVCIITIQCGHEIQGPNIHLKSDLETCSKLPAARVNVELPSPLHDLFEDFPELDEFPHLTDIATARITLFQEVQNS